MEDEWQCQATERNRHILVICVDCLRERSIEWFICLSSSHQVCLVFIQISATWAVIVGLSRSKSHLTSTTPPGAWIINDEYYQCRAVTAKMAGNLRREFSSAGSTPGYSVCMLCLNSYLQRIFRPTAFSTCNISSKIRSEEQRLHFWLTLMQILERINETFKGILYRTHSTFSKIIFFNSSYGGN